MMNTIRFEGIYRIRGNTVPISGFVSRSSDCPPLKSPERIAEQAQQSDMPLQIRSGIATESVDVLTRRQSLVRYATVYTQADATSLQQLEQRQETTWAAYDTLNKNDKRTPLWSWHILLIAPVISWIPWAVHNAYYGIKNKRAISDADYALYQADLKGRQSEYNEAREALKTFEKRAPAVSVALPDARVVTMLEQGRFDIAEGRLG